MNKFELGKNANICILIDNYPDAILYEDNNPFYTMKRGVALRIWTDEEKKEPIEIVMDKEQAKAVIKGLKMQIRNLR